MATAHILNTTGKRTYCGRPKAITLFTYTVEEIRELPQYVKVCGRCDHNWLAKEKREGR